MVCQFCYDRPIVRATGQNGKVIEVGCRECGAKVIHGSGAAARNAPPRRKSNGGVNDGEIKP